MDNLGTYMWVQNKSTDEKDTFVINGKVYPYEGTDEQDIIFNEMQQFREHARRRNLHSEYKNYDKEIRDYKKKHPNLTISDNFQCYQDKKNKRTLILSCHLDKDESGRSIPFIYLSYTLDISKVCDGLKDVSNLISRKCNDNEIKMLNEITKKNDPLFTIIIIITIIIIFIVWIKKNS